MEAFYLGTKALQLEEWPGQRIDVCALEYPAQVRHQTFHRVSGW
jgi:hypothetical protein